MKFDFKKIASVIAGTVMMSSTLAFAAAANYPAPFVQNGGADVAIVYGSQPGAEFDLVAVADVTTNLQAALAAQTATSGSSSSGITSGSDYIVLAKPSDKVNLGNSISTVFGTSITSTDLPDLLADGTYSNDVNSDFDYEQRITLGSGLRFEYFANSDYNDNAPTLGANLSSNQLVLNYSLDFTTDAESSVSGGDLVDLETTTIKMLGKEYYISDVDNSTLDITLLDTANSGIATEGESTKVTVGSTTYDVSISFVDSTSTRLTVNGETTNSLSEGGTYKLSDGTYVGVKDILYNSKDAGISKVEFSLGSGKLVLRNGNTIQVNDDSIQGLTAEVKRGSASGGKERIDRINLVWTTDDNAFITDTSELAMPGLETVKFSMSKPVTSGQEITSVEDGSATYLQLKTTLEDGDVTIPILYAINSSGEFYGIGKDASNKLVTRNINDLIFNYTSGDRAFIASWNTSTESESYYLRFTSFQNDNGVNKTTVESYKDGAWVERCKDRRAGDTCTLGSLTLTVNTVSPYNDRTVNVTGNSGSSFNTLYTKGGLKVFLPYGTATSNTTAQADGSISFNDTDANMYSAGHSVDSFNLVFVDEDRNSNVALGNRFNVTLNDNSNGEVEVSSLATGRTSISDPDDSNHISSRVYDDLGTLVERKGASSDQRTATVTYNSGELYADFILTTKDAAVSSTGGSSGSGSVKELGSVLVKDSEVSSVSSKNLIVVGGSCVNTLASELLGGASCGSDFTAKTGVGSGSFLVQTFSRTGGKVATLVAGYNAADTQNAAKVLTSPGKVDVTAGKKYVSTSATSVELQTTATA